MVRVKKEKNGKKPGWGRLPALVPILFALVAFAVLVLAPASAANLNFTINGTVNQIIDEMILIIPNLIDLILQMLPAVIVLSLLGFVTGFFDKILGMFK